jgi:hypothetical protein
MSTEWGDCPTCVEPLPRELEDRELRLIPRPARRLILSTPGRPFICDHCGCVYKINTPPTVFGHLNNPLKGRGWVSEPGAVAP